MLRKVELSVSAALKISLAFSRNAFSFAALIVFFLSILLVYSGGWSMVASYSSGYVASTIVRYFLVFNYK